jgi:hypothetical protein
LQWSAKCISLFLFKGNGEDGLHLAYSKDGLEFTALNEAKPFLRASGMEQSFRLMKQF